MDYIELEYAWIATAAGIMPVFKGALIRGALGYVLREAACQRGWDTSCGECDLLLECSYARLFEAEDRNGSLPGGFRDAPRPYVIEILDDRRRVRPGDSVRFTLRLLGTAIGLGATLTKVVEMANIRGVWLGDISGQYVLIRATLHTADDALFAGVKGGFHANTLQRGRPKEVSVVLRGSRDKLDGEMRVRLQSWMVLKRDSEPLARFDKHVFATAILRRLETTLRLYGRTEDADALRERREDLLTQWGETEIVVDRTHAGRWGRKSSRQGKRYEMDAIGGEVVLRGVSRTWDSLLQMAQAIHIGKGCTFGLGAFTVERVTDVQSVPMAAEPSGENPHAPTVE